MTKPMEELPADYVIRPYQARGTQWPWEELASSEAGYTALEGEHFSSMESFISSMDRWAKANGRRVERERRRDVTPHKVKFRFVPVTPEAVESSSVGGDASSPSIAVDVEPAAVEREGRAGVEAPAAVEQEAVPVDPALVLAVEPAAVEPEAEDEVDGALAGGSEVEAGPGNTTEAAEAGPEDATEPAHLGEAEPEKRSGARLRHRRF